MVLSRACSTLDRVWRPGRLGRSVPPRRMSSAPWTRVVWPVGGRAPTPSTSATPTTSERTLPALRAMSDFYFRAEVRGMDNVPARGPALLVGNHSGGTLIVDTFVFAQAFYDHFGADREFYQLAHDLVFKVPGVAGRTHAVRNGAGLAAEHAAGARARRRTARVPRRRP